jgi:predicted metal-dependent hydrolase
VKYYYLNPIYPKYIPNKFWDIFLGINYGPSFMKTRIIRSAKRTKTVSAREVDGELVVRAPAHMSDAELEPIIETLQQRITRQKDKDQLDDNKLHRRAQQLNRQYFKGKLSWQSIKWVTNQNQRVGSCTPSQGTIRLSHRLAKMPGFVLDYVIVHELAHLLEANHGAKFWKLVNRYPKTERARGYLMAVGWENLEE